MGFHQIKVFCTTEEAIIKVKKQPRKLEEVFENCTSEKGLIPRIYKELKTLN
jgi:hypothetical protein